MKNKLFLTAIVVACVMMATGCVSFDQRLANEQADRTETYFDYMRSVEVQGGKDAWEVCNYVDDFKNPTANKYISAISNGTFANSATNGSELIVETLVDKNGIDFALLEYGSYPLSASNNDTIRVSMNVNGQTTVLARDAYYHKGTKRISMQAVDCVLPMMQAMVNNPQIQILIEIRTSYGSYSKYLFPVDCAGFEYAYHEAFLKDNPASPQQ